MGCGKCEHDHKHKHHSKGCVCEVVRAIKEIQDIGTDDDCATCSTSCFMEPLGGIVSPGRRNQFDTRVFMLLTKNGDPFKAFYRDRDRHDTDCFSVFFRVEEVFDNCCATLRVLEPRKRSGEEVDLVDCTHTTIDLKKICATRRFRSTESCITVDLSCFCGVQCIDDVFLDIC
ncbi:CotY/CotZ family spore coat protein [Sporosarcina pasteurii]|uniref:Spore coat protein Z n=1 Tax=Sporosarcina pasteurii TaxID=1474 RepID=A0A380BE98_SPOPA|nr:CotY/CotZ family spore coat protein [Sporosarcina pasteurii]MDS9470390.1 CotY/CotZ family spore coat protein [Sporosarcina pasteurii]QBQ05908.1 spore coat protein CotZ [Sporosarcina pasteurii]SUI99959.1 Spore coat protein Z [Sporosarcina pasteurii]